MKKDVILTCQYMSDMSWHMTYRSLYCAYPVCSQVVFVGAATAGDRAGCWAPRQLSETRSATAVNGSQLAR